MLRTLVRLMAVGVGALVGAPAARADVIVDNFTTIQVGPGAVSGAGILGMEREFSVIGTGAGSGVGPAPGTAFIGNNPGQSSQGVLLYNGVGAAGLGGLDLTQTGVSNKFSLSARNDQAGTQGRLRVFSGAGNSSTASFGIPQAFSLQSIDVLFSAFANSGGTGANFMNVSAIELILNSNNTLEADVVVGPVSIPGTPTAPPLPPPPPPVGNVPEPTTLAAFALLGALGLAARSRKRIA